MCAPLGRFVWEHITMDDFEKLMLALDKQSPDWAARNARENELTSYALDHGHNQDRANRRLRVSVATRLTVAIRAALEAGLVVTP